MVKYDKQRTLIRVIDSRKMTDGQTGIITEDIDSKDTPVMKVYSPEGNNILVALSNGRLTWTNTNIKVRLCDFELKEII